MLLRRVSEKLLNRPYAGLQKYTKICENMNMIKDNFNAIKEKYIHSIPVNVIGLANELGVEVYSMDIKDNDLSGFISKDENGYFICVNENHPATRQQFTIAHEIGHLVLHQNLVDNDELLPTTYKLGVGIKTGLARSNSFMSSEYRKTETEANKFAAELLMPTEEFIKAANECDDLNELANRFNVSVGAASIRANTLEIEIF